MSDLVTTERVGIADVEASIRLVRAATALQSADDYAAMGVAWRALRDKQDAIVAHYKPRKAKARLAYDQWLADEHADLDPVKAAIAHAATLLATWDQEQRRLAQVEEARLAVARQKAAEDQLLNEVAVLQTAGEALNDPELLYEAYDRLERGVDPVTVTAVVARPDVEGMAMREGWTYELKDRGAFLAHLATHPEFWSLIQLKDGEMKRLARQYRQHLSRVLPGVVAVSTSTPKKG